MNKYLTRTLVSNKNLLLKGVNQSVFNNSNITINQNNITINQNNNVLLNTKDHLTQRHVCHYSTHNKPHLNKSIQQSALQLKQTLKQQIQSQQSNLYNQQQYSQLLKLINWNITKNNSILQLTKTTSTHQFHAFITIKPPIQMSPENKQSRIEQKQMEMEILQEELKKKNIPSMKKHLQYIKQFLKSNPFDQPFSQITIFVQKLKPKSKYLCIEYLANSKHAQIEQISLLSKIVPNRIERIQQCHQYDGRPITQLDVQKTEMIFLVTESEYQLRNQVLQTMFQLACCYQQQQYIQWLKNFNQIL